MNRLRGWLVLREWHFYVPPLLMAAWSMYLLLRVVTARIFYPYELEWIEGSVLHHVVRILQGKQLYVLPDMEFAPALYTPLYYYVSAVVAHFVGAGLPALRLVSFVSSLFSCVFMGAVVWRITASRLAVLLVMLLYASVFHGCGFWYDIARVDSLWVALMMGSLYGLVSSRLTCQGLWLTASALLLGLSVFTKQTSFFLVPFWCLAIVAWHGFGKALLRFLVVFALTIALLFGFMQWHSDGRFWFFTMQMAQHHGFTKGFPGHFVWGDLGYVLRYFLVLAIVGLTGFWQSSRRVFAGWLFLLLGFSGMAFLSRLYVGGYLNVVMSMDFFVVVLAVAGFHYRVRRSPWIMEKLVWCLLLCLNIFTGYFEPARHIPSAADRAYGDALLERISEVKGDVCIFRHGYLAYLAGKEFCAHESQVTDIMFSGNTEMRDRLYADFRRRIGGLHYEVLLLDSMPELTGYVDVSTIPYDVSHLDNYQIVHDFEPVEGGPRPRLWLQLKK